EAGDLVLELLDPLFELLDLLLLEGDNVEQLLDKRRAIGLKDIGQVDPHDRIRPATSRPICPWVIEKLRVGNLSHFLITIYVSSERKIRVREVGGSNPLAPTF